MTAKQSYQRAVEFADRVLKREGLENAFDRHERERFVMAVEAELRLWMEVRKPVPPEARA